MRILIVSGAILVLLVAVNVIDIQFNADVNDIGLVEVVDSADHRGIAVLMRDGAKYEFNPKALSSTVRKGNRLKIVTGRLMGTGYVLVEAPSTE